jgi:hypothetical protein
MLASLLVLCALHGQLNATDAATYSAPWPEAVRAVDGGEIDEATGSRYLSLHVVDARGTLGEPVLGRYRRQGERLVLVPRFSLDPAARYQLRYVDAAGSKQSRLVDPAKPEPSATPFKVAQVYPTADVLPANLLKFYIHFSQPVREGREIFDLVSLINEQGEPVAAPWLLTELWNEDATRLTLRIHPGRVKQGVNLRESEGLVLNPGKRYTLRVSGRVQRANAATGGVRELAVDYTKSFRVSAEDHTLPQLSTWLVTAPSAQSREPLVIHFPEPLDPHLAKRCIEILDPVGKMVAGEIAIGRDERSWTLTPNVVWQSGEHQIVVDEVLEDLAGNTPTRPFEVNADTPRVELPRVIHFRPKG